MQVLDNYKWRDSSITEVRSILSRNGHVTYKDKGVQRSIPPLGRAKAPEVSGLDDKDLKGKG